MIPLASVFVVIIVSLLITRVATVALSLTGLSRESARFQARSALSGVGFTTTEAESVVNHPVRRRVVMLLMLIGSASVVTVLGTLILSFAGTEPGERDKRILLLLGGLLVLWLIARSHWVDRRLSHLIARGLDRWTDLDARDYAALLHLAGSFGVMEIAIDDESWVAGRTLGEMSLRDEGVIVLGVSRPGGRYLGAPGFGTRIEPGDTLVVYGRTQRLCELGDRTHGPDGDAAHEQAIGEHRDDAEGQAAHDDAAEAQRHNGRSLSRSPG